MARKSNVIKVKKDATPAKPEGDAKFFDKGKGKRPKRGTKLSGGMLGKIAKAFGRVYAKKK